MSVIANHRDTEIKSSLTCCNGDREIFQPDKAEKGKKHNARRTCRGETAACNKQYPRPSIGVVQHADRDQGFPLHERKITVPMAP